MSGLRWLAAAALLACGCRSGITDADAEALVRRYCEKVIDAYRASDAELLDPLVGDEHGQRLTGLIGVKRDMNVVLDAVLHELVVEGIERRGGEVLVVTRERWTYRDRQIGSGAPAGPASEDRYHVRYRLGPEKDRWVVRGVDFVDPPVVDRGSEPAPALDARKVHGLPPREER